MAYSLLGVLLAVSRCLTISQASTDNTTCYGYDSKMNETNNFVCPGSLACCGEAATCMSNRLCHNPGEAAGEYVRGPCAVTPYDPSVCGAICLYGGGSGIWLDDEGNPETKSPTSSYTYSTFYGPLAATPTSSSTSSTPSSSSATTTTSSSSTASSIGSMPMTTSTSSSSAKSAPSSGLSTGAKAGIGVGVGVGGAAVLAILTLAWVIHRKRGQRSRTEEGEVNSLQALNTSHHDDGHGLGSSEYKPGTVYDGENAGQDSYQQPVEVSGDGEVRELSGEQRMELPGSVPETKRENKPV
ncbi:hypothetical protein BDV97DRAFT_367664 [Delphinella strobiligena]|nr:hypothetical protein BDV97DRAFT_367664 [Delphinella strobiligena]